MRVERVHSADLMYTLVCYYDRPLYTCCHGVTVNSASLLFITIPPVFNQTKSKSMLKKHNVMLYYLICDQVILQIYVTLDLNLG